MRYYSIHLADGTTVNYPSVTTILKVINKADALIPWAINEAMKVLQKRIDSGKPITRQHLGMAKSAHKDMSETAMSTGTLVHQWIENYLLHKPQGISSFDNTSLLNCTRAWLDWWSEANLTCICPEMVVHHPLGFAGTLDMVAQDQEGGLLVADWKTSSGIWPEYWLQIAAYAVAWEYLNPGQTIQSAAIVRLPKGGGPAQVKTADRYKLENYFTGFIGALNLFNTLQELEDEHGH